MAYLVGSDSLLDVGDLSGLSLNDDHHFIHLFPGVDQLRLQVGQFLLLLAREPLSVLFSKAQSESQRRQWFTRQQQSVTLDDVGVELP